MSLRRTSASFRCADGPPDCSKSRLEDWDVESQYDYFGARYYDARIGRWLATEPLNELFPTLSPYVYALGNPVSLVDVDGRFTPLGHCRVIQAGFTGKASWREIGPFASVSMQAWVDVKYMDYPRVHFDNLKSFEAVLANFRYVADLLKAGDTDSKARAFHAIGDFYAHSNYVELWIQFYGTPASVSEIPTIYEVLANPQKYAEFISFLEKNLQTEGNAEQHDALGKDDETTSEGSKMVGGHTLFQHAVDVAGRHVASEAVPEIGVPAATTKGVQARKWQRYDPMWH